MAKEKKDLVQIIKDNPGCVGVIDNDCWWIKKAPPKPTHKMTDEEYYAYDEDAILVRDGEIKPLGDGGYGSGCVYGGDILQALAHIVGMKIESV